MKDSENGGLVGLMIRIMFFAFSVIILISVLKACEHEPEQQIDIKTAMKVQKTLDVDSINSRNAALVRYAIDSIIKAMESRQAKEKTQYKLIYLKDKEAEQAYFAGKISCDTVIVTKNKVIEIGKKGWERCDSMRIQDSLKMNSFKSELAGKDKTIGELSEAVQKVVKRKEPFHYSITAGAAKEAEYWNPTIGATMTTPKGFSIGYSAGMKHSLHDFKVGFRIR